MNHTFVITGTLYMEVYIDCTDLVVHVNGCLKPIYQYHESASRGVVRRHGINQSWSRWHPNYVYMYLFGLPKAPKLPLWFDDGPQTTSLVCRWPPITKYLNCPRTWHINIKHNPHIYITVLSIQTFDQHFCHFQTIKINNAPCISTLGTFMIAV